MKPKKGSLNFITIDPSESIKLRIFERLNELVQRHGLTIIFAWRSKKDHSEPCWDDVRFQSNGPVYDPDCCVFCGRKPIPADDRVMLDGVSCDCDCFRKNFVDRKGPTYLPPTTYRQPAIIIDAYVPGSLDNAVMELAWALGVYRRSVANPLAPHEWVDESAIEFAARLVSRLEAGHGLKRRYLS